MYELDSISIAEKLSSSRIKESANPSSSLDELRLPRVTEYVTSNRQESWLAAPGTKVA
jgi:hypothetical protein